MSQNRIVIENLKGIKSLDFKIPNPGVHVLTASNGSGKTTLMVCIERLKGPGSLKDNFIQHRSPNVDSYATSKITYHSKLNNKVSYTYRSSSGSWWPTTQNAAVLNEFGYDEIVVIPTLGKRVYIQNKTISGGRVRYASEGLRSSMSTVLENDKFDELRKMNLGETRGRGGRNRRNNTAFILPGKIVRENNKRTQHYYSESSFSLGEIFTLNLLFQLQVIEDNSLLVIDELEVALHPRVQINLLNYLEEKADEKNLTVIISTHSSSIIKCAKNLIYLQNGGNGEINVNYGCYSALALQEVAIEEDIQPDYTFFVEDDVAELLLKEIILKYFQINSDRQQPLWKVLPIGGYPEVLRFIERANQYLLNRRIGQYAFLDHDVEDTRNELRRKGNNRTEAEEDLWNLFQSQAQKIKYLEITPELGVMNWLLDDTNNAQALINNRIPDAFINLIDLIRELNANFSNDAYNPRRGAKSKMSWLVGQICGQTNEDKKRIERHLFSSYVENWYSIQENRNNLNQLFGPIFNRQGN